MNGYVQEFGAAGEELVMLDVPHSLAVLACPHSFSSGKIILRSNADSWQQFNRNHDLLNSDISLWREPQHLKFMNVFLVASGQLYRPTHPAEYLLEINPLVDKSTDW